MRWTKGKSRNLPYNDYPDVMKKKMNPGERIAETNRGKKKSLRYWSRCKQEKLKRRSVEKTTSVSNKRIGKLLEELDANKGEKRNTQPKGDGGER